MYIYICIYTYIYIYIYGYIYILFERRVSMTYIFYQNRAFFERIYDNVITTQILYHNKGYFGKD